MNFRPSTSRVLSISNTHESPKILNPLNQSELARQSTLPFNADSTGHVTSSQAPNVVTQIVQGASASPNPIQIKEELVNGIDNSISG